MDYTCKKYWQAGVACRPGQPVVALGEPASATHATESAGPRGVAFGVDPHPSHPERAIPIPGYDAPGLPIKASRDPALSLIALSGVDPSAPLMVEVPLVQNQTAFTATAVLVGQRVGVAERFDDQEPIEHSAAFRRALGVLRRNGVQLVPVAARAVNSALHFTLQRRNEVDELLGDYRLDALVSDSRSGAFHNVRGDGYAALGEPLEDGATLWFYSARGAQASLVALVQAYRSVCGLAHAPFGLPDVLNSPTT